MGPSGGSRHLAGIPAQADSAWARGHWAGCSDATGRRPGQGPDAPRFGHSRGMRFFWMAAPLRCGVYLRVFAGWLPSAWVRPGLLVEDGNTSTMYDSSTAMSAAKHHCRKLTRCSRCGFRLSTPGSTAGGHANGLISSGD